MLSGQTRFPGEEKSIAGKGLTSLLYPFTANPGATIGAGLGAYPTYMSKDIIGPALRRAYEANKNLDYVPAGLANKVRHFGSPKNLLEYLKTYRAAGSHVPAVVKDIAGTSQAADAVKLRRGMTRGGKLGLASIPIGLVLGALANAGLKGQVN